MISGTPVERALAFPAAEYERRSQAARGTFAAGRLDALLSTTLTVTGCDVLTAAPLELHVARG